MTDWRDIHYDDCGHSYRGELHPVECEEVPENAQHVPDCLCPRCEEEQELREAALRADDDGLPALTGTPKQVLWAQKIRRRHLRRMTALQSNPARFSARLYGQAADDSAQWARVCGALVDWYVENRTDADDWIDVRDGPDELIHVALKTAPNEVLSRACADAGYAPEDTAYISEHWGHR